MGRSNKLHPSAARRRAVLRRDGWQCYLCRRQIAPGLETVDHVCPKAKGGSNGQDNLRACCAYCNQAKGNRRPGSPKIFGGRTVMDHIDAVALALGLVGYEAGTPPWVGKAAAAIDREVAAGSECPACGREGLEYRPYHRRPGSYRAFALCPDCSHVEEF